MTARQLAEWEVFLEIDQLETTKNDFRLAYILTVITNLFISAFGKSGGEKAKLEDYLIDWWNENTKEPQTVEDMKQFLMSFAKAQNTKVAQKKNEPVKRQK